MGPTIKESIAKEYNNEWFKTHSPKHIPWVRDEITQLWLTPDRAVVVPPIDSIKMDIMMCYHHSTYAGHQSAKRTYGVITHRYFWPGLRKDVDNFVRNCQSCQRQKPYKGPRAPTQAIPVPNRLWGTVQVDFMTTVPVTKSGNDSVAVFVDKASHMIHIAPFKNKNFTSPDFQRMMEQEVVRLHGMPNRMITDRDKLFTSEWWKQFIDDVKLKHHLPTAYHPRTDGLTEKLNDVVESALRHYINNEGTDWDKYLSGIEFALNNALSESLGTSPFLLNYGFYPRMPVDVIYSGGRVPNAQQTSNALKDRGKRAREFVAQAQARYSDPHLTILEFSVDDYVLSTRSSARHGARQAFGTTARRIVQDHSQERESSIPTRYT